MANPNWKEGVSGNPSGRPKKDRALTAILEAGGSKTIDKGDGTKVARKRLMSELLWQAITEGKITLPNEKEMAIAPSDWFDVVQFMYKQIDGPPPQAVEMTGKDGAPIEIEVDYKDAILRKLLTPDDTTPDTGKED